jgi:hypothetical protein
MQNSFRLALRFIYNDYNSTYENLLIVSKLPTLKERRLRTMTIEVYKILHQESPSYLHDLIKIKDTKYCFRYDKLKSIQKQEGSSKANFMQCLF